MTKDQIEALKEEYAHTVDNLKNRLEDSDVEIDRLRALIRTAAAGSSSSNDATFPASSHDRDSVTQDRLVASEIMRHEERQSGEVCVNFYCQLA